VPAQLKSGQRLRFSNIWGLSPTPGQNTSGMSGEEHRITHEIGTISTGTPLVPVGGDSLTHVHFVPKKRTQEDYFLIHVIASSTL
jgi:hypothetical protein